MRRLFWCAAFTAVGCTGINFDLDSVTLRTPDAATDAGSDAMSDAAPLPDATSDAASDTGPDAAPDSGDTGGDGGNDADMFVSNCEIPQPVDEARCNPTVTGMCPGDGFCTLALVGAPPPQLVCLPRDREGTGLTGAVCTGTDECAEGHACVNWTLEPDPRGFECTRFCEIETNRGCVDGEFCAALPTIPLDGIGYCTPECDPYDPEACPAGQTCNVDYSFPVLACQPRFRCLETTDFLAEGEECGPGRSVARCAEDLVCYEVQTADFRCVAPCQTDAECAVGTCAAPFGPWALRYCSP